MTRKPRALLQLTIRDFAQGLPPWWPFCVFGLLVQAWLFLHVDSRLERVFGSIATFVSLLYVLTRHYPSPSIVESAGYLSVPPISRASAVAARAGLAITLGLAVFGVLGAAAFFFVPEPTLALDNFDSLKRFEAAGFTLGFEYEANRKAYDQWPAGDQGEGLQTGIVRGLFSPQLVCILFGLILYTQVVLSASFELRPPQRWKALGFVWLAFGAVPWLALATLLLFRAHLIAEAIYLHPMLTTVSIGGLVLVYAVVCVWRWRCADV